MKTFCSEKDPVKRTKTLGENICQLLLTKDILKYIKELSKLKSENKQSNYKMGKRHEQTLHWTGHKAGKSVYENICNIISHQKMQIKITRYHYDY